MPYPDNFNAAAYARRWEGDPEEEAERLYLGAAIRTNGARLVEAFRSAETSDAWLNEQFHELAEMLEKRMDELAKRGDL